MNLLFSMSLAGSLVLLIYLVIKPVARRFLPAIWRYRLLKIALLFYLLPYQYLKYTYAAIGKFFFPTWQPGSVSETSYITSNASRMVLVNEDGHIHFENHVLILFIFGIWMIFTMIYLLYNLIKYMDCMEDLQQITKVPVTLPDATNEQRPSRKPARAEVSIFASQHITTPFTIGLLVPRIILPASMVNTKACRMIISHELEHVKNHDNLIKLLCLIGMLLHWYNPFIYLLYWEICKVSEQVCDAAVIQNMSEPEIEQYKLLIIELGQKEPHIDTLLASPFNGRFKMIKERMIVMNKTTISSKRTRIVASLLMAALLLALSPVSVLAYSPAPACEYQDQHINVGNDFLCFASGQTDLQDIVDPFLEYGAENDIFIDANGQSYVQTDSNSQIGRILCFHSWVDGKLYSHDKHDDGSCTLYCYNAQMCTTCKSYRNVTLYCEYRYTKCPH